MRSDSPLITKGVIRVRRKGRPLGGAELRREGDGLAALRLQRSVPAERARRSRPGPALRSRLCLPRSESPGKGFRTE